ncbi:MAG: zinc-binding dehydrogenase [Planctomycetota bacterium]|nr:zinc-binding dehydrogenase [Planctomycetota bacterium]
MWKVVVHRPGGFGRLVLEEHPEPEPAAGEVLVAAEAVGVNFADCAVRMGHYESARRLVGWPITPGFELAGRVAAVGARVERWRAGDAVFALTRFGGYASHAVVPEGAVFAVPAGWSAAEAAAFPTVHLTAWYALHRLLDVRAGMRLLVHSAAGGVGGALLQLARAAGARTLGVVGAPHKLAEARRLGADAVIDTSATDLWPAAEREAPAGFDGILDANGVATLRASYRHLAPEGRLVVYGFHTMLPRGSGRRWSAKLLWSRLRLPRFDALDLTTENKSVMGFNLSFLFDRTELLGEAMGQLLEHVVAGRLVAPRVETFPLRDAARAHARLQSGETVGKLVLVP